MLGFRRFWLPFHTPRGATCTAYLPSDSPPCGVREGMGEVGSSLHRLPFFRLPSLRRPREGMREVSARRCPRCAARGRAHGGLGAGREAVGQGVGLARFEHAGAVAVRDGLLPHVVLGPVAVGVRGAGQATLHGRAAAGHHDRQPPAGGPPHSVTDRWSHSLRLRPGDHRARGETPHGERSKKNSSERGRARCVLRGAAPAGVEPGVWRRITFTTGPRTAAPAGDERA